MARGQQLMIASACVIAWVGVSQVVAQPAPGMPGRGPMYDPATEATFTGIVEKVEPAVGRGRAGGGRGHRGLGGTHLTLQTDAGPLEIHLGPSAFLVERGIDIVAGDALQLTGARMSLDDESFVVAREIKKEDQVWRLRDESGRPLWSGRGR